jgi:carboxypeptidase family protein
MDPEMKFVRRLALALACACPLLLAQLQEGEIRVKVSDPAGLPLPSSLFLVSQASRTERTYKSDDSGQFTFQHLPVGVYHLTVSHPGFAPYSTLVEIRSAVPKEIRAQLSLQFASTQVEVKDSATLIDPHRTGVAYSVGAEQMSEKQTAVPGRGVLDLVNMQPGWLFEANGTLHPRGSEYQTQFVVDGLPMYENRSPNFASGLQTERVSDMTVLTGNIPAEYGRKLGGIVEVNTNRDITQGLHGTSDISGGSFGTVSGFASASYGWKRSSLTFDGSADTTGRYLDPPVLGNFTNQGTLSGFGGAYTTDVTPADRLYVSLHRSQARFEVPNENLQQVAGQLQNRNAPEVAGLVGWSHVFSPTVLLNARAAVEDLSANLWSNSLATPIIAAQQRGFRRSYLNSTLSVSKSHHDLKFGADALYSPVTEALQYQITDPSYFAPDTPGTFNFYDHRLDREQSLFAQDTMRYGNLTVSTGLRWDHYSLVVHDHAFSPRLGVAWYIPKASLILRFSYDRVFNTPALENLLLASSPQLDVLNTQVLRIPIQPSRGNYLEAGFSQGIANRARLDVSFYQRSFRSYADDDVFLNTGISFPIAFQSALIRGVDVKLDLPRWGRLSGFLSYSNLVGTAQLPVTGGLLLGSDISGSVGVTGSFPITQDQRNTARARGRYQVNRRLWVAADAEYGSGLPVEINGDPDISALREQYGSAIVDRVNFDAGRVRPNFSLNLNAGLELWTREKKSLRAEGELENLTNRLNVINFSGLFSGTAIGLPRSGNVRLRFEF